MKRNYDIMPSFDLEFQVRRNLADYIMDAAKAHIPIAGAEIVKVLSEIRLYDPVSTFWATLSYANEKLEKNGAFNDAPTMTSDDVRAVQQFRADVERNVDTFAVEARWNGYCWEIPHD